MTLYPQAIIYPHAPFEQREAKCIAAQTKS
jgi:hypothetical protein